MPSASRVSKETAVKELRERFAPVQAAVVSHYAGINVEKMTKLRADLRKAKVDFRVVKNTLLRRAVEDTDFAPLQDHLVGPTILAMTETDAVEMAKVLVDFAKTEENLRIQAGVLSGKLLQTGEVEALAKVPPREVLLARLAGALSSPYAGFTCALSGILRKLVYALDAIRRKKEEEEGR